MTQGRRPAGFRFSLRRVNLILRWFGLIMIMSAGEDAPTMFAIRRRSPDVRSKFGGTLVGDPGYVPPPGEP